MARIAKDYGRRWRTQLLLSVPMLLAFSAAMWLLDYARDSVLGVSWFIWLGASMLVLAAVLVAVRASWRCPVCRVWLGKRWNPRSCPHCGASFRSKPLAEQLTQAQQWALAAAAVPTRWSGENLDRLKFDCGARASRESLKEGWGVTDHESYRQTRDWLLGGGHDVGFRAMISMVEASRESDHSDDSELPPRMSRFLGELKGARAERGLVGWDLSRLINVVRLAHTAGYMGENEAWAWIGEAARRLQDHFGSWIELGDNFCIGYSFWDGGGKVPSELVAALRWVCTSPESPCSRLPWKLDLPGRGPTANRT